MSREISPERKAAYYFGLGMMIVGGLLFASFFLTFLLNFGDNGPSIDHAIGAAATRAFIGFALIVIGGITSNIGARGAAGSGVLLDPNRAREDLEPWTRMAGGMIEDALSETELLKKKPAAPPMQIVKVRCPHCHALNDENARFCGQCGKPL